MKKLKKISWLMVTLVGLFLTYSVAANQYYGDWQIENNSDVQFILSMENKCSEKVVIACSNNMYFSNISLPDNTKGNYKAFFDYQIDNHNVIFKGNNYYRNWSITGVWYPDKENEIRGEIDKYQTLFQQMLKAKESLTVNLIDTKGHIYRSISFSVKGLPEALIEFAKQCGPDFQTYSGIEVN